MVEYNSYLICGKIVLKRLYTRKDPVVQSQPAFFFLHVL